MNCVRFSQYGRSSQLKGNEMAEGSQLRLGTWHGAVYISIQEFSYLTQVPGYLQNLLTEWTFARGREVQTPQPCTTPDSVTPGSARQPTYNRKT